MNVKITLNVQPGAISVNCDSGALQQILTKLENVMAHLTQLETAVRANTQAAASVVQLLGGIAAKLEEFKDDPVRIQTLVDEINSTSSALAAAALAHTPADPNP